MRITFFDMRQEELEGISSGGMCAFCQASRQAPAFDELCRQCDAHHLESAKCNHRVQIYHCHAGLLEGIVPLYNSREDYIGSIVFGQCRDSQWVPDNNGKSVTALVRESNFPEMEETGELLKYIGEYICDHELISFQREHWIDAIETYINAHLNEKISLKQLSSLTGYSTSFLSHNFKEAFGLPLKTYIRKRKMSCARRLLASGKQVRECAFALGYIDEFYFSRDFKKYYGYPPKAAKKATAARK